MITTIIDYLAYFDRVRERTLGMFQAVPSEKFDWQPKKKQFTCADLARHIGSAQLMNWGAARGEGWHYPGHGDEHGASKSGALGYLARCHLEATVALRKLPNAALNTKVPDLKGKPTPVWRILMATVEHEIHHRGQLAMYVTLMGLEVPQLFGVGVEELPME